MERGVFSFLFVRYKRSLFSFLKNFLKKIEKSLTEGILYDNILYVQ
ncbi:hypothetical protein FUSO6_09695 [Fusobacterium necrophorum DAB]|nr:hypothetical protein FUSO6_09695 [Fusobacterium necrophorum DAB]